MTSRRQLKKNIKAITGDLFADCVALSMCQQANREELEQIMKEILALHTDYVARISHTERGSERTFYRCLKQEFTQKANNLSERIIKA